MSEKKTVTTPDGKTFEVTSTCPLADSDLHVAILRTLPKPEGEELLPGVPGHRWVADSSSKFHLEPDHIVDANKKVEEWPLARDFVTHCAKMAAEAEYQQEMERQQSAEKEVTIHFKFNLGDKVRDTSWHEERIGTVSTRSYYETRKALSRIQYSVTWPDGSFTVPVSEDCLEIAK